MQKHITVLQSEAIEALAIKPNAIVVDATLGSGGHARTIIPKLLKAGTFIGIDADAEAISQAEEELTGKCTLHFVTDNFRNINSILDDRGIGNVDAILADLGWRMEQFSGNGKGFSFQIDEPLMMTFGNPSDYPFVASDILNKWKEKDIENVLMAYGEERYAYKIAKKIVEIRAKEPIMTTFQFVKVITSAVPSFYLHSKVHPATRSFQALRIAVNDELDALQEFIQHAVLRLNSHGRLAIISFQSLEDRIVKHSFRALMTANVGTVITKKPMCADKNEIQQNPRARSAKLRIFEKI